MQNFVQVENEQGDRCDAHGRVFAGDCEKINPAMNQAPRHQAIGKHVKVTKGPLKGYTGYVNAYNYVFNTFLVDLLSFRKKNIEAADLVYV